MVEDSRMIGVGKYGASIATGRLGRIALLALAGAIGAASEADAALYYWSGYYPGYYLPAPTFRQRLPRVRRHQAKRIETPEKESTKPQGPLIIAISIERQKLKIYDAKGFFAETPISTGMRGHPTPMGVFSVIQKHKFHHSNIYSGAPMPYMQRITWSGVAMHAGVLPGRPASHGCIRMPMAFAMKMWNWTRMGARVVITPGEINPTSFSHPLLATLKVQPQPVAAQEPKPDAPTVANVDKAAAAEANARPAIPETRVELRSTLGHDDRARPAADETRASAPPQTRTADASNTLPATNPPVTMSDAAPGGGSAPKAAEQTLSERAADSSKAEAAKAKAEPENAKRNEVASNDKAAAENPAEAKPSEAAPAEIKPAEAASGEAVKVEAAASETNKAEVAKVEAKADDFKAEIGRA